jgi:hypothetical protein
VQNVARSDLDLEVKMLAVTISEIDCTLVLVLFVAGNGSFNTCWWGEPTVEVEG